MRKTLLTLCGLATVALAAPSNLYEFKTHDLKDKMVDLNQYRGKVALVVNTASECGFTRQYAGLEKLYREFKGKGLVVLGFPSNDFGGQEPGNGEEIQQFCSSKFQVSFPLFAKVVVKEGPQQSPIYAFLGSQHDKPSWNFGKYLVNREGKVVGFFGSRTEPDSPELRQAVQKVL